jgi:hypothetical protein
MTAHQLMAIFSGCDFRDGAQERGTIIAGIQVLGLSHFPTSFHCFLKRIFDIVPPTSIPLFGIEPRSTIPGSLRYSSVFAFIIANRRSVTGSRLAENSSLVGFRLSLGCSFSSHIRSTADRSVFSSALSSRKDEDRSNDLTRLPSCCFRKTLKTLILSLSATKSMSPFSVSRFFRASLTEFLAV